MAESNQSDRTGIYYPVGAFPLLAPAPTRRESKEGYFVAVSHKDHLSRQRELKQREWDLFDFAQTRWNSFFAAVSLPNERLDMQVDSEEHFPWVFFGRPKTPLLSCYKRKAGDSW